MAKKCSSKKSPTLDKMLAQSGKEELIEIIKTVVKRDPSMKEVVDLAMAAPKPGAQIDRGHADLGYGSNECDRPRRGHLGSPPAHDLRRD
jgi:hypothetical protein